MGEKVTAIPKDEEVTKQEPTENINLEELKKELQALKDSFNDEKIQQVCEKIFGNFINKFDFKRNDNPKEPTEKPKSEYDKRLENWKI